MGVYTVKEAAEMLEVPARVVRRLAQDGQLPGVVQIEGKHGRPVWRLSEASLQALRELAAPQTSGRPLRPSLQSAAQATLPVEPEPSAEREAPLPWHAVQLLLAAERERAQTLEQALQRATHSEAMLREQLREERDEVLRLRTELAALRQHSVAAQQPALQRKSAGQARLGAELADRPTEPIDLEQFRLSLSQSEPKR